MVTGIFLWLPNVPENSSGVLNCIGNDDVIYFKYDYFTLGGYSRKKNYCHLYNIIRKYMFYGSLALLMLVSSNLLEIYLTSAVMFEIKKSTKSVMHLLSKKSLADRKRYLILYFYLCIFSLIFVFLMNFDIFRDDGIVIAITFWQWFVASISNLLLIGLVAGKVIIEKTCCGRFLWKISEIRADFGLVLGWLAVLKKNWADYEQLLSADFFKFSGAKKKFFFDF